MLSSKALVWKTTEHQYSLLLFLFCNNPQFLFLIILLFLYSIETKKIMWCIHIFPKGFFASLISTRVKQWKAWSWIHPKLTGNRKTGPHFKIIYKFWWILFFCANISIPINVCLLCFCWGWWIRFPAFVFKRNFQSMRNNSPKKTNKSFLTSLFLLFSTVHPLRNVGVHFTVFWRPRQVFSFY